MLCVCVGVMCKFVRVQTKRVYEYKGVFLNENNRKLKIAPRRANDLHTMWITYIQKNQAAQLWHNK